MNNTRLRSPGDRERQDPVARVSERGWSLWLTARMCPLQNRGVRATSAR